MLKTVCLAALAGTVCVCPGAEPAPVDLPGEGGQVVYWDTWDPVNGLTGGRTVLAEPVPEAAFLRGASNIVGPADELLDIVFVGDGYTAAEIPGYRQDAANAQALIFAYEPFITYLPFIRFHTIDVVSNESGVDNDPTLGVERDTALDMRYWCNGIERLLCVDVAKAYQYANQAPDVDQVVALANSNKYGGAGYPSSNLGTAAAKNSLAGDIVIHELGHALGNLADEYTYGGPTVYTGPERPEANASILTAGQMQSEQSKWFRWLGDNLPGFDGPNWTFEGAYYSEQGAYRPSNNSMMRALGRPFNLPSAEKLIIEIHRATAMIRSASPSAGTVDPFGTMEVGVVERADAPMTARWSVNGVVRQTGTGLYAQTPGQLGAVAGDTVRVDIVDDTPWVRDEAARAAFLTESFTWPVTPGPCSVADLADPLGQLTFVDIFTFLSFFNMQDGRADLAPPFGQFTFADISAYFAAFSAGCP